MKFVDWFAGIGGFRLGLERAGHACAWSCELAAFPRAVYAKRFGLAPEGEDICGVRAADIPDADLWCGGFPCQDLSTAGSKVGINGERSGLVWRLLALAGERRPEWILLENVANLLTGTDGPLEPDDEAVGADADDLVSWCGVLLGALVELGYVGSARVLDARYFGLAQKRRRVFILARRSGEGARPGAVLLEPESRGWDRPEGRASRAKAPRAVPVGAAGGGGKQRAFNVYSMNSTARLEHAVETDLARAVTSRAFTSGQGGTVVACFSVVPESGQGADLRAAQVDLSPALTVVDGARRNERGVRVVEGARVRRLTLLERERLQGFPDGWTDLPDATDEERATALGNAVPVAVTEWIGRRLPR